MKRRDIAIAVVAVALTVAVVSGGVRSQPDEPTLVERVAALEAKVETLTHRGILLDIRVKALEKPRRTSAPISRQAPAPRRVLPATSKAPAKEDGGRVSAVPGSVFRLPGPLFTGRDRGAWTRSGGKVYLLWDTVDNYKAWAKAKRADDKETWGPLQMQHSVMVNSGEQVRTIDTGWFHMQLRVLTGGRVGQSGWIERGLLTD